MKTNDLNTIKIWRFEDAPKEFRDLSTHGGDEDWVAFIPTSLLNESLLWMESGTAFGLSEVRDTVVEGGVVRIGAHA